MKAGAACIALQMSFGWPGLGGMGAPDPGQAGCTCDRSLSGNCGDHADATVHGMVVSVLPPVAPWMWPLRELRQFMCFPPVPVTLPRRGPVDDRALYTKEASSLNGQNASHRKCCFQRADIG